MNVTTSNKRLLALDVMRGITIAGMILVNTPGSWQHAYAPLKHAEWIGLTPTDLVFPFFMFIMGISTYISLRKYNFTFSVPAGLKILKTDRDHFPDWNWHQLAFPFSASSTIPSLSTRFAFSESCNGLLWDMELLP